MTHVSHPYVSLKERFVAVPWVEKNQKGTRGNENTVDHEIVR